MRKVIVAPLNWGLGHASRCVPIINALIKQGYEPVIASDGDALLFLRQEFQQLSYIELPPYKIFYGKYLKWTLLAQLPKIIQSVKSERKVIHQYINDNPEVVGIISDNRFGCHSKLIPSVYLTHQINVFSGLTSVLSSWIHHRIIKRYNECWIPDEGDSKLSGKLSISKLSKIRYIGVLSRFKFREEEKKFDILVLLSGPEPNRTNFEKKILNLYKTTDKHIRIVRGVISGDQTNEVRETISFVNFLTGEQLEKELASAELILCRSGYSSIMDLSVLGKKVIFIPTKGQSEQEYLAKYHFKEYSIPFVKESKLEKLNEFNLGSQLPITKVNLPEGLFHLFQGK